MKTLKRTIQLTLPLLLVGFLFSNVYAGGPYSMTGKISAINEQHNTVVVQVPLKDNQMMTVGGPVVPNAKLRKDGKKADLNDFNVGDKVVVTWRKTDQTLPIYGLRSANQSQQR